MMGMGGGTGGALGGMNPLNTGRFNMPGTGGNMGIDMHRIPVVGNMFQNPYDLFKQQQMQNAAAAYSMYRPEAQQAWMNAQNMQASQLQPMNNALAAMYGAGATQGFEAQNPFGATAFQRGAAVGTSPGMPTPGQQPPSGGAGGGGGGGGSVFGGFGPSDIDGHIGQFAGYIGDGASAAGGAIGDWGSMFSNWAGSGSNWAGLGNGGWW